MCKAAYMYVHAWFENFKEPVTITKLQVDKSV